MGENCSHGGNFLAMKMGLVLKSSEEHSAVRGQGSEVGVRVQNRGHKLIKPRKKAKKPNLDI